MKTLSKKFLVSTVITVTLFSFTSSFAFASSSYYTNSSGNKVHIPVVKDVAPVGATAQCRDKTYSYSQHRRGTCSHHGGVRSWL
jgi:hypothetical protein